MGERLFLEEDTKTLHTLHPSVIIIGERIKSIREEIDDDVNDDKERRQKRMRGEEEETAPLLKSKSSRGNFDVESRGGGGGGGGGGRNSFAVLNEELRRDALVNSVSNADTLSETLERAHTTASETDDAGETILKSLSQQKHRLLSARAAAASMERDMESSERKLRRMGYEKCIQRWMWHVVALCVVAALGTFAYFKITADAHRKNGRHLSDYKIIDRDDETGKFV